MIQIARSIMALALIPFSAGFSTYSLEAANSQSVKHKLPEFGLYHIHGSAPVGFDTFYELEIDLLPGVDADSVKADQSGDLPIEGALFITPTEFPAGTKTEQRGEMNSSSEVSFINLVRLKFVAAKLRLEGDRFAKISFVTEPVGGTSYSFDGEFLAKAKLEKGSYVELTGTLRKLKDGRKVVEAKLKFLRWADE
jgi:hypothetical protein